MEAGYSGYRLAENQELFLYRKKNFCGYTEKGVAIFLLWYNE